MKAKELENMLANAQRPLDLNQGNNIMLRAILQHLADEAKEKENYIQDLPDPEKPDRE